MAEQIPFPYKKISLHSSSLIEPGSNFCEINVSQTKQTKYN